VFTCLLRQMRLRFYPFDQRIHGFIILCFRFNNHSSSLNNYFGQFVCKQGNLRFGNGILQNDIRGCFAKKKKLSQTINFIWDNKKRSARTKRSQSHVFLVRNYTIISPHSIKKTWIYVHGLHRKVVDDSREIMKQCLWRIGFTQSVEFFKKTQFYCMRS
jgi:hypothetical protein